MTPDSWLITGGCGFIGVNLIDQILKVDSCANIRVLDNLSVGTTEDLREVTDFSEVLFNQLESHPTGVELFVGDIKDFDACLKACKGIEVVVHLAANTGVASSVENPRKDTEVNVIGTFNMLEASRRNGVKKFIFASSCASLGEVEPPIHEQKAPKPVSPYGASKLAGEGYCSAYYRTFGLKTVSLRFGNVYGPRSKHKSSIVAKFFKQAIAGETLEIYGDGKQTRDFLYIDDLVQAIFLVIDPKHFVPCSTQVSFTPNPAKISNPSISPGDSNFTSEPWGEVFQIATHKETTVNEIASKIKEIVESETNKKVNLIRGEKRLGDVMRNYSDISKAKRMLGYSPKYNLIAGLKHTFLFFNRRMGIR